MHTVATDVYNVYNNIMMVSGGQANVVDRYIYIYDHDCIDRPTLTCCTPRHHHHQGLAPAFLQRGWDPGNQNSRSTKIIHKTNCEWKNGLEPNKYFKTIKKNYF